MADKKEFTLKVNGLEQSIENVEKLNNSLDKVDVKARGMSVTASDVADAYKDDIKDVMEYIVLQMTKIGAIVTELNTHVSKAIEKNIEAGEKLAESMEKSTESGLSSVKVKAIEASTLIEAWIDKVANRTEEQLINLQTKQAEQLDKNKELLEKSTAITKEYDEKDKEIGILNLKAHKENTEARIGELKKYKAELEATEIHTRLYYSSVISQYAEDSAEFKQAQEEKQKALEDLQIKIAETDKELKETNSSYWNTWKKQHQEIKAKLDDYSKDIENQFDKFKGKYEDAVSKYTEFKSQITQGIDALENDAKKRNEEKYKKKIDKLDKELKEVRIKATEYEKEKAQAEKEQAEAKIKAEKYRDDIKKIKDSFEIKDSNAEEENNDPDKTEEFIDISKSLTGETPTDTNSEGKDGSEGKKVTPVAPPTDEELKAANERIEELDKLAKAEEDIVKNKQEAIEEANNRITESNRSILLEEMRIADQKTKLQEEKAKKEEEIAKKAQKKRDALEKIEKIKAKAKLVFDIAVATKDIAKGVATAWGKGPILGPPLAALVALNGAMQLKMMTAQLAKFQDGGLLHGKRHSQGGMRIEGTNMEVEGGEFVVNRVSTDKNLGLVKYINEQRRELKPKDLDAFFARSSQGLEPSFKRMFAQGGQLPTIEPATNVDNDSLIKAIQAIKIEPKVAVTDIHRAQDNMVSVSGWSGV